MFIQLQYINQLFTTSVQCTSIHFITYCMFIQLKYINQSCVCTVHKDIGTSIQIAYYIAIQLNKPDVLKSEDEFR